MTEHKASCKYTKGNQTCKCHVNNTICARTSFTESLYIYSHTGLHYYATGVGFRWKVIGEMTGWLGSSVVECSHGQQKTLGLSASRATIFHLLQLDSNTSTIVIKDTIHWGVTDQLTHQIYGIRNFSNLVVHKQCLQCVWSLQS